MLYIEVRVRVTVAGQERPEAQRVAGMARTDEDGVAYRVGDQVDPAQHECPQKNLTKGGIALHDAAQRRPVDFQ